MGCISKARTDYPAAAVLNLLISNALSCSGSLVGGKQVLPEQTNASGLSFGRCGRVSRSANGNEAEAAAPGKTRSTDLPNRKTEFAADSSAFAVESSAAPATTNCGGWCAKSVAANP